MVLQLKKNGKGKIFVTIKFALFRGVEQSFFGPCIMTQEIIF
jgi:hypothetical protein